MHEELSVALNFIISHLYNKLPRRRVDVFREELESGFKVRFQGHWYPEEPSKGSAFRCVKLAGDKIDPVVDAAVRASGLDMTEVKSYLPGGLTIWIDPREVSCRVGEHGHLQVLYRKPLAAFTLSDSFPSTPEAPSSELFGNWNNCFDRQSTATPPSTALRGFGAGIRPGELCSAGSRSGTWPSVTADNSSPHQLTPNATFTAATFAQTKFGSTKMKTHGPGRQSKLSPSSASPNGGFTRLSPTGSSPVVRWNLSPTAQPTSVGSHPASARLSPVHLTGPSSPYLHHLQSTMSTTSPSLEHDMMLMQLRDHQQLESYLRISSPSVVNGNQSMTSTSQLSFEPAAHSHQQTSLYQVRSQHQQRNNVIDSRSTSRLALSGDDHVSTTDSMTSYPLQDDPFNMASFDWGFDVGLGSGGGEQPSGVSGGYSASLKHLLLAN